MMIERTYPRLRGTMWSLISGEPCGHSSPRMYNNLVFHYRSTEVDTETKSKVITSTLSDAEVSCCYVVYILTCILIMLDMCYISLFWRCMFDPDCNVYYMFTEIEAES